MATEANQQPDELRLRDEWMAEAKTQTLATLPAFLQKLAEHPHDYGTICRAIGAGAVAAASALNRDATHGGITGFQAGCVMWDFMVGWGTVSESEMPRIQSLHNLLFPQYDRRWTEIDNDTWECLQAKAKSLLVESPHAHPNVKARWESVAAGNVPCGFTVTPKGGA